MHVAVMSRSRPSVRRLVPPGCALVVFLAGCAATPDAGNDPRLRLAPTCARIAAQEASRAAPAVETVPAAEAALRNAGYAPRALQVARLVQVDGLLAQLADGGAPALEALALQQRVNQRILLAMIDVQSVLAELDCEQARGERLRAALDGAAGRRAQRYSLFGIVTGALTAIASGGLAIARPESDVGNWAGIIGGTAESAIGVAGLADGGRARLDTPRNLLHEVWSGNDSRIFPATVWRFLNGFEAADMPGRTLREGLVQRWRADERLGADREGERRIALLFGDGGTYGSDDLQLREALLDLLQARVWLMHQELELLMREVVARSG